MLVSIKQNEKTYNINNFPIWNEYIIICARKNFREFSE